MKPGRRRLWLRILAALGLCAAGGLLLLAFAPLPVGWLINRHGRDLPEIRVRVDSATLRLRPFGAGPTLAVRGLAVDQDNHPLARIARFDLFARKAELLDGRVAATVEATELELTLPAADPAGKNADDGAPPPDLPALLSDARSWLAADPRALSVSIRDIRIVTPEGLLPPGVVAPDLERVDLVLGPRPEGELVARTEIRSAAERGPVPVIEIVVAPDNRSAIASLDLPAAELAEIAAILTPGRPPETLGRLAARMRADLDLVSLRPGAATLEVDGEELRAAPALPFAFPPAALRLRLRANAAFDQFVADRFELTAPDLEISLPGLEVGVSPQRDQLSLRWGLRIAAAPARAWPAEWKNRVASLPPPAAALAAELSELKAEGTGSTVLRSDSSGAGTWRIERAEIAQTLLAALGPTSLRLALEAKQPDPAAPIAITLRLPELNPAAGRAEGDKSPLAALDAALSAEAELHVTPELKLADARLRFSAGPGKLRPISGLSALGKDLPFSRIEFEAASPDGREIRLEKADFAAGDSRVSLAGSHATWRADGRLALDLKLAAAAPRLDEWAAWLPPETDEALKPLGWKTSDVGVAELGCTMQAVVDSLAPEAATFDLTGAARVRIGEDLVPLEWTARRKQTAAPVSFALRLPRLAPGVWPGRPTPDFAWSDLRVPVDVEAEGRLEPPAFAPHVRVKARAGAGLVVLPASAVPGGEVIALRDFSVEAAVAGDPLKIEVPELRLRLDEAVALSVTGARVDLRGDPKAEGRWAVSPLTLVDALAAWPEKIEPELRTRVAEHVKGGRVERLSGEFAVELPPGAAPKIGKAEVDVALADVSALGPLLPVPVKLRRAEGALRWPRVTARVEGMELPGLAVSSVDVELADMTVPSWTVAMRAAYVAELAALPVELGLPKGVAGRVTGSIAADAKLRPEAGLPDELTLSGRVAVAALEFPGVVGGEASGKFGGGFSGDRQIKFEGVADASCLTWRFPELAGLRAPAELSVKAAAKLDAEWRPESASVALSAPDALGQPFALRLAGEWAKGRSVFPAKVDLAELAWGRSCLSGELVATARGPRVNLRSPLIVVPEIVTAARPRLASIPQPGGSAPLESPQASGSTPSALASLVADVKIERIELGEDRSLRGIELAVTCGEDGLPLSASLNAAEGASNRLLVALTTKPDGGDRSVELRVDDVPRWAAAASAPLRVAPPAPTAKLGELEAVAGVMLGNLDTIVSLLAGGSLEVSAVVPKDQKPPRLQAVVAIRNATVLRAPRIVQLLALKSGREIQKSPLVREFSIQSLSLHDGIVEVAGVKIEGSGLIDRLKINKGSYALDGETITVDLTYFGIGFDVDGTRRDPQVWFKNNNLLIRAIGTESNLDFGE